MIVVACIFYDGWVGSYDKQSYLLTDNETKFVNKFFGTLYTYLATKHMTKTA